MNKQNRPNPFWIKITIVTTIFLCSFFFDKIDYYNEILKIISLIILIIKPLKNTVKDILSKKGFNKNFNITLSTLAIASIGYINESILTLLIYQIISYLENNKNNQLVVEVQKKKKTELTNIKRLKIGDIIKIQPNQPINLAGILQSKEATLLVNDNILKKSFGEKIDSGCTNLNSTIEIKVTEKYQNSKLKNDNDYVNNIIEEYRKKQDYTYINKIMRVIALILIFLPNLLTGEIQNRMIIIGSMFLILASSDMTILIEEKYLTKIIKNLRKKKYYY